MSETVIIAPEESRARLEIAYNNARAELDSLLSDWTSLMVLIAQAVGTDDDRECAEMGEVEDFDPWHALRNHIANPLRISPADREALERLAHNVRDVEPLEPHEALALSVLDRLLSQGGDK